MPTALATLDRVPNNNIPYPVQVVIRVNILINKEIGKYHFLIFDTDALLLLENNKCQEEITKLK